MTTTSYDPQDITKRVKRIAGTIALATTDDEVGGAVDLSDMQSVSVQVGTFTGTVQFEVQNRDDGAWVSKALTPVGGGTPVSSTTASGMWSGDIGARRFRVRRTAGTSTTATVDILAMPESQANVQSSQAVVLASGGAASNPIKNEDSVHASGDAGMHTLGVRVPASPAAQTSAVTDYGSFAITAEGKQVIAGQGAEEHLWDACVDLTTTADVPLIASAGAGLRRVVTDITLDNTGASPARVLIKDGTTRRYARTIPANSSVDVSLKSPIRGTAAAAVQAALGAAGTVTVSISGYIGA